MAYKKKSFGGVGKGFRHIWKYRGIWDETKIAPRTWKIKFRASKGKKSSSYGGYGKGTKGIWDIKAKQYIVKTGKGKYQTTMIGTKKSLGFNVKKPKLYKGRK